MNMGVASSPKKNVIKCISIFVGLVLSVGLIIFVKKRFSSCQLSEGSQVFSAFQKLEHMKKEGAYDFTLTPLSKEHGARSLLQKSLLSSSLSFDQTGKKDSSTSSKESVSRFSHYKGHIILLNFWASWCEPCIREFPHMIQLAQHVPHLKIITLSRDKNPSEALEFLQAFPEAQGQMDFFWDPEGKITKLYGTDALPESYIIGLDFKVIKKIVGAENWSHPKSIKYFNSIGAK